MEESSMPSCCVLYITDPTYFFPTLVSAMQARRHTSPEKADVLICHLGVDPAAVEEFATVCAAEDIRLVAIDPNVIEGADAQMARLFLNRFVPVEYSQYLYMDGDVHITGSLDGLVDSYVPEGYFLAANDPMTFQLSDNDADSRDLSAYLISLGMRPAQAERYFNSGVLRINRAGWERIGRRAWEMVKAGESRLRFSDQDALNLAGAEYRLPMSLAWNFPIFMRNARVETHIKPVVYHFMSRPKPWDGVFAPWTAESYDPYRKLIQKYPVLRRYQSRLSPARRLRYFLQQNYKRVLELFGWGFSQRRARILDYEGKLGLAPLNSFAQPLRST